MLWSNVSDAFDKSAGHPSTQWSIVGEGSQTKTISSKNWIVIHVISDCAVLSYDVLANADVQHCTVDKIARVGKGEIDLLFDICNSSLDLKNGYNFWNV